MSDHLDRAAEVIATARRWVRDFRRASPSLRRYLLWTMALAAIHDAALTVVIEPVERIEERWRVPLGRRIEERGVEMRRRFREERGADDE